MTGVHIRRGRRDEKAQERRLSDNRGRNWREAAVDLGAPRIMAPPEDGER